LRRASTGTGDPTSQTGDSSTTSSDSDDKPTLHRRDDQN
jgi:hypothetical protein